LTDKKDASGMYVFEYYRLPPSRKDLYTQILLDYTYTVCDELSGAELPVSACVVNKISAEGNVEDCLPEVHIWGKGAVDQISAESYVTEYNTIEKIKTAILQLKEIGFYEELVREIGSLFPADRAIPYDKEFVPSRLYFDSQFNIYLRDYNNREIKMTALPKSLFILFLRHPEGILLKQLSDYEPELMGIYKLISNRENYEDMTDSIKRMCSPLDSSINEKISRIREAFVKVIAPKYADYYIITGLRGEKKQIKIDRNQVSLPDCFNHICKTGHNL
jgi:hypothetical protein